MTKDIDRLPPGTPVFGRCYACKEVLVYPAIRVAAWTKPGEPGRYQSEWRNYCIDCGIHALVKTKPEDIIPEECWDLGNVRLVPNPIRSAK